MNQYVLDQYVFPICFRLICFLSICFLTVTASPKRAYFGCPVTKILDSPKWHWLIFAPMGALAYFIICINKCCVLSSLALQLPTYQHHTYIYVNLYMMIPNDSDLFPNHTDEEVPI